MQLPSKKKGAKMQHSRTSSCRRRWPTGKGSSFRRLVHRLRPLCLSPIWALPPDEEQALLLPTVSIAVAKLTQQGADLKPVMEALAKIITPAQAASEPVGK